MIIIRPLKDNDSVEQILKLFVQLTGFRHENLDLQALIQGSTHCLVAFNDDENEIIGFGSLVKYLVPSKGEVGHIEDVVIDEKYRGEGLGKKIMQELIAIAKQENLCMIDLSSNRTRITARKFYETLGFKMRESDIFRLILK